MVLGGVRSIPDKDPDRQGPESPSPPAIRITRTQYKVYCLLVQEHLCQSRVARCLKVSRQSVNEIVSTLEILGLIQAIDPNDNPKFYRPTFLIPVQAKSSTPVVSGSARKKERSVRKRPILVRDRKTGRIKKWKSHRRVGCKRDYDTVISVNGRRLQMIRAHVTTKSCAILRDSAVKIPWTEIGGMKGMKQYVYKFKFKNRSSALFDLRQIEVTFLRQTTKSSDELIIYMPEKYFLEHELDQAEKILEEFSLKAWKWFSKTFRYLLSYPSVFKTPSYGVEIDDAIMKNAVKKHRYVKSSTEDGNVEADESKVGHQEEEYPTLEQVKARLHGPERILKVEKELAQMKAINEDSFKSMKDEIKQELKEELITELKPFLKDCMKEVVTEVYSETITKKSSLDSFLDVV